MATVQEQLQPMTGTKEVALVAPDPQMQMLQMMERLATNKDVDVVKLQALIDMQKDILQVNAKAAFNAAFARLQQVLPTVIEKGKTNNGHYARLEDIIETVRPMLGEHGFSLSHRTEWPDPKTVKVIGILTHEQGYSRESEFIGAADQSGNKNAIQALGSTVSYGRRYTTKDLLNIVTKHEDDDGGKADPKAATEPDGFEAWFDDMDAAVVAGATWKQWSESWNKSKEEFRVYLAKTNVSKINAWKKKTKENGAAKEAK